MFDPRDPGGGKPVEEAHRILVNTKTYESILQKIEGRPVNLEISPMVPDGQAYVIDPNASSSDYTVYKKY